MEIKKPNDIFTAVLMKPDVNEFDLTKSNVVPENTQLLTPDDYKKLPKVQELFTAQNGKFDDVKFNSAYAKASELYSGMSDSKTLYKALEYDPMDFTAPKGSKKIDTRPTVTKDINPFKELYGRTGINSIDSNDLSLRELAQNGKVWDTKENKWLDKSANDLGLFGSLFGDTMVYAQWDKNGESKDPISGRIVKHTKGEWKYDEDGNLYVETLGDREVFGKQIVNPTDLITKEGTWLNKIDFFDSDGKDKSAFGTAMKMATQIAPFFIPGVGEFYAGAKLALGMAEILPTLYKAGEGLFLGDNKGTETASYKAMTETEGFLSKFSAKSFSDAGQQSLMNFEQLANTVSDIFSLIHEQRAAAKLASMFYKSQAADYMSGLDRAYNQVATEADMAGVFKSAEEVKAFQQASAETMQQLSANGMKQSQLAKNLGLGYMALSQATPVYNEALEGGYDKRTASFAALGAVAAQYAVMNNHIGTWILDNSVGYSSDEVALKVKKAINDVYKSEDVKAASLMFENPSTKEAGKKIFGKKFLEFKDKISDLLGPAEVGSAKDIIPNIVRGSLAQGVEMVALTGATDMAKGITDFLSELGMTKKKGTFGGLNNVFSEQGYQRYLSTAIGGIVGGPIFELERSIITPLLTDGKILNQGTKYSAQQAIADGLKDKIFEELDRNKSRYGNTELSAIPHDVDGNKVYLPKENVSQADAIVSIVKQYLNNLENTMNIENLNQTDEQIFKKALINQLYINDFKRTGTDRFMLSDFRQNADEIIRLRKEIDGLRDVEGEKEKPENKEAYTKLSKELGEKRQWVSDFLEGKMSNYYHSLSLFALNSNLHSPFLSLTAEEYVKEKYDKDFFNLSKADQEVYQKEFNTEMDNTESNYKNKMKIMFDSFIKINEDLSGDLADYNKDGYSSIRSRFYKALPRIDENLNIFSSEYEHGFENALKKFNDMNKQLYAKDLRTYNLDLPVDLSLGKFLVDRGFIEMRLPRQERIRLITERTKELANANGIERLENEADDAFANRVYRDVEVQRQLVSERTKATKNLKSVVPDYENKTIREVLQEVENSKLSDEEKDSIKTLYADYDEAQKRHSAYNNLIAQQDIESNQLEQLGHIGDISDESIDNLGVSIKGNLDKLGGESANRKWDESTKEIDERYRKLLDQGVDFTDDNMKALVAMQIDSLPLSNTEPSLRFVKDKINELSYAKAIGFQEQINELKKQISDPQALQQELSVVEAMRTEMPDFKVKELAMSDNSIISPKRELLLHYAEEVIKNGEGLDRETIDYLAGERKKIDQQIEAIDPEKTFGGLNEEESDKLNEYFDVLQAESNKIDEVLKYSKTQANILLDKLRNYEIQFFGKAGPVSVFQILKENTDAFNRIRNSVEYKQSDVHVYQLKRGLATIQHIKSLLTAMSSTELSASNLYGFNVSLNKALEKEGLEPKYATLSNEAALNMFHDLTDIERKLDYLKTLAEANQSTMVEYQAKVQGAVIKGIFKQYTDKANPRSIVNLKINGESLISEKELADISDIKDDEEKLVELENKIYTNFHNLSGDVNTKLDKLFSPFIEGEDKKEVVRTLTESANTDLTENFDKFESFDWYKYLHYTLAYNSKESYLDYKNNVKNEVSLPENSESNKKAPFYIQQLALREALAYFENKRVVQHIVDFVQKDIEDSAMQKLKAEGKDLSIISQDDKVAAIRAEIANVSAFPIKNLQTIVGSGGTGKSSFIANWIVKTILNEKKLGDNAEVYAIAPSETTLKVLTNDIGKDVQHKINSFTIDDFFKQIALKEEGYNLLTQAHKTISETKDQNSLNSKVDGEYLLDPKYFIKGEGDGAVLVTKEFLNQFVMIPDKAIAPKVLIADEMSKFTTLQWQILNHLGRSGVYDDRKFDNYYILPMGDDLQNGIVMNGNSYGMENIFVAKTTKLKVPIRAKNVHKNNNNILLEKWVEDVKRNAVNRKAGSVNAPDLAYYDEDVLVGDKFSKVLSDKDLDKLDTSKEIVILSDDKERDTKNIEQIQNFFKVKSPEKEIPILSSEVQGREFDQVIILADMKLANAEVGDRYSNAKNMYTLLSRAKEATLIIGDPTETLKNEASNFNTPLTIDQNIINSALEERFKRLTDMTEKYERTVKPEEKVDITPEVIPNPESSIFDLEEDQPDIHSEPEPTYENKDYVKPEYIKEDNITFGYSFFNNIGTEADSILPFKDYKIGAETDNANKVISWDDLKSQLGDSVTGTDLFSLPYRYTNEVLLKTVLADYIKFKNKLLFSQIDDIVKAPDKYLNGMKYKADAELFVKRLDRYSNPYGKLVGSKRVEGDVYVLGKYIDVTESGNKYKKFITLAALPDINNDNVKKGLGAKGLESLQSLYAEINRSEDKEVTINKEALSLYSGVVVPKDPMRDPKNAKTLSEPIEFGDIADKLPGVTVSKVNVFRDNIDFIRDQIQKHQQTKYEIKDEFATWSKYRFRPYVTLSYIEGVNKYEKLAVLQPKGRTLTEFWKELVEHQEGYSDKQAKAKYNSESEEDPIVQLNKDEAKGIHLISMYKGWEIMRDFLNSIDVKERQKMVDRINGYFQFTHQQNYKSWEPFKKVLDAIIDDENVNMNFKDFVNSRDGVVKGLLTAAKDTKEFNVSNPVYIIHRMWANDFNKSNFGKAWDLYMKDHENDKVYYNAVISSEKLKSEEGSGFGSLSQNQFKYYTLGFATESNQLKIDLEKLRDKKKPIETPIKKQPAGNEFFKPIELIDIKTPTGDKVNFKFEISANPIENQIPLKISNDIKGENKDKMIGYMNMLAEANVRAKKWALSEEGNVEFKASKYSDEEDVLDLKSMLSNIYDSDNYVEKNGQWDLAEKLGDEYERRKVDAYRQKTKCKI